jgi:Sulfotransferase family
LTMMAMLVRSGVRLANAAGSGLQRAGVSPVSLAEESLLSAARQATNLEDFGDDDFREPFRLLLRALESEANLTLLGRVVARRDLVGLLITRLRLQADRIRHPAIASEHIAQPVFIVGLPRSGSTLLHHLLGQDPLTRVPQAWEAMYPSPPPARATYDTDPRIAQATRQLRWLDWLAPDFKTIHPVGARLPLECIALMSASFRSTRFQAMYNIPSYEAWLEQGDMRPGYAFHRSVLQQLQWRAPGARWVLKAPSHLFAIDALLHTYPDARIVQTHRDPVTVIGSLASMSATLQGAFTDRLQPDAIGREILRWTRGLERSMQLRHGGPLPTDRFVDVHYHELTRDPLAVVRRIYTQFAMPFSRTAETAMGRFLADNPKDKHGPHRYTLERFGFDTEGLAHRFKGYSEYFEVPPESATRTRRSIPSSSRSASARH